METLDDSELDDIHLDDIINDFEHRCYQCGGSVKDSDCCPDCELVYYCSIDCAEKDWDNGHWDICPDIHAKRRKYEQLEDKYRSPFVNAVPPQPDPFEDDFEIYEEIYMFPHDYLDARFAYILATLRLYSREAIEEALDQSTEMIRLEDDFPHTEAFMIIPLLLLRLGRYQESFAYVKWKAFGDIHRCFEWGRMDRDYMHIDFADVGIFQPVDRVTEERRSGAKVSCFFKLVVILMKIKISVDINTVFNQCATLHECRAFPPEICGMVEDYLLLDILNGNSEWMNKRQQTKDVLETLSSDIYILYKAIDRENAELWETLLEYAPKIHISSREARYLKRRKGDIYEVIAYQQDAWFETPGAFKIIEECQARALEDSRTDE